MPFEPLPIATTAQGIKSQGQMKRQFIERLRELGRPEHEIAICERELHELQSAYAWLRVRVETEGDE